MALYTTEIYDLDHSDLKEGELQYQLKQPINILIQEDPSHGYWIYTAYWGEMCLQTTSSEGEEKNASVQKVLYKMKKRIITVYEQVLNKTWKTASERTLCRLIEKI